MTEQENNTNPKDEDAPIEEQVETSENVDEQSAPTPEQQVAELTEKWRRVAADYQNYQRRAQQRIEESSQMAQENVARALLPVLDNFLHTLEKGHEATDVASVMQGVQIVYDHLLSTLTGLGLKRIGVEPGSAFDPAQHEAMLMEESSDYEPNTIIREVAPGYVMGERTLRPAKVALAKAPVEQQENDQDPDEGAGSV